MDRDKYLKGKYGISEAQFLELAARRGNRCWICGRLPKRLQVDHDHKSSEIRGLLCGMPCNRALDYRWTRGRLLAAAEYMDPNNWTGFFVPAKKRKRKKRLTT